MTVIRIKNPNGDEIEQTLRELDKSGAVILSTSSAADSWFVVYEQKKEPKPRAPRQPREVR